MTVTVKTREEIQAEAEEFVKQIFTETTTFAQALEYIKSGYLDKTIAKDKILGYVWLLGEEPNEQ